MTTSRAATDWESGLNRIAAITNIHGSPPAPEASLDAVDAISVDASIAGGSRRLGPHRRGVRADRGAPD